MAGKYDCPWCYMVCDTETERLNHLLEYHVERLIELSEDVPKEDKNELEQIPAYNS